VFFQDNYYYKTTTTVFIQGERPLIPASPAFELNSTRRSVLSLQAGIAKKDTKISTTFEVFLLKHFSNKFPVFFQMKIGTMKHL